MTSDANAIYSLSIQATILFIAIILFVIYYFHLFIYEKHNRLALAFAIVTFIWLITITYRYFCYNDDKKHLNEKCLLEVPYGIKCTIGDEKCENGNCTLWIFIHMTIYFLVGLYQPGCYIEIILISIFCESIETGVGHTSKYIVDPLINMTAYIIGSALSCNWRYCNMGRCQIK